MSRVQVTTAYAYRWKNRPPNLASSDDFVIRFTDVEASPGENACMTFGGGSRTFSINKTNNLWYPLLGTTPGVATRVDMETGGFFRLWGTPTGCSGGGPPTINNNISQLLLNRTGGVNNSIQIDFVSVLGGTAFGNAFARPSFPQVAVSDAVRVTNTLTTPSAFTVGINGNAFLARGPLTSSQVQNLFNTI